MVALEAEERAQVGRLHVIALARGGSDDAPPGERRPGFYAACFRDPDGDELNAYVMD